MAPPRLPPELIRDVAEEILIHIPPDEPADLVRASAVCKAWLRIVSDPAFLRRYRAFRRSAPLLGFLYQVDFDPSPRFISTAEASPLPQSAPVSGASSVLDSRHGRVLFTKRGSSNFLVWDPIADGCLELQAPELWHTFYSAVVLCTVAGRDHRDCRNGPFLVVYVGKDDLGNSICAYVYSSETHAWGTPVSAHLEDDVYFSGTDRAALVGDAIYWKVVLGDRILKYDLIKHCFSMIDGTNIYYEGGQILMQNEDGSLGLAGVSNSRLHLWSRMVNPEGVTGWVQQRVIKLKKILPKNKAYIRANVIGFAEGVRVLFMSTDVGTFTFELNSGRVRKVSGPGKYCPIFPFISFCTPEIQMTPLGLSLQEEHWSVPSLNFFFRRQLPRGSKGLPPRS
ncbi:unnamed protein product [Urochloa decumbens]|uniref:F-box domain-containing protein n=1 Tax=Urochloa decumbens TaxID=240449 RepID=A0ABC9FK46_9POAL